MLDGEICKDGVGVVSRQDLFQAAAAAIGATNNISKADDPLRVWPLNLAKFSRPSSSSSLGKLQRLLPQLTRCCCRCQCNARVCNIKLKQGWQISRQQMIRSDIVFLSPAAQMRNMSRALIEPAAPPLTRHRRPSIHIQTHPFHRSVGRPHAERGLSYARDPGITILFAHLRQTAEDSLLK